MSVSTKEEAQDPVSPKPVNRLTFAEFDSDSDLEKTDP